MRLSWGTIGERYFETGVDRGVLYVDSEKGVPWNGLVSVSESSTGGDATSAYIDGVKYLNNKLSEEFEATIEAYTYPDEFSICDGSASVSNGLFATQQKKKSFGLCYRTKVGNDVDGVDHAYKLHLVYNAKVAPASRANTTIGPSFAPDNFSWDITTKPPALRGYRPTAHFVIDSRETPTEVLAHIEDVLYGTDETEPRLPVVPELVYIFESATASFFDGGVPGEPFYGIFDGGAPGDLYTTFIDGGAP